MISSNCGMSLCRDAMNLDHEEGESPLLPETRQNCWPFLCQCLLVLLLGLGNFNSLHQGGGTEKKVNHFQMLPLTAPLVNCLGLNTSWCCFFVGWKWSLLLPLLYGGAVCPAPDAVQKCCFQREGRRGLPTVLLGLVHACVLSYGDALSFPVLGWEMHSLFFFCFFLPLAAV